MVKQTIKVRIGCVGFNYGFFWILGSELSMYILADETLVVLGLRTSTEW